MFSASVGMTDADFCFIKTLFSKVKKTAPSFDGAILFYVNVCNYVIIMRTDS